MAATRFYRRRLLNRRGHHAGAYVLAASTIESWQGRAEVEASVTIADCNRLVSLEFGGATPAEISNTLFKAHALRYVLVDFTEALEQAAVEVLNASTRG